MQPEVLHQELEETRDSSGSRPVAPQITPPPELPPATPGRALLIVGLVVLFLLSAGALTALNRMREQKVLAKETEADAVPIVAVVHPTAEVPDEQLMLPGTMQAYIESPIYARTSGYLLRWYKDIGSHVTKGDLLAEIDTPEVDQQLLQAKAARQQIQAQLNLNKITAERYQNLRKTDSVAQQDADQQTSSYEQAQANLAAADANVRRLEEMEGFKRVYAPFTGVLTKRNIDPGALINAGAAGREMFDIAQVDPLRVYVNVPQAYAPNIKQGMKSWVTLQEFPGRNFEGKVVRTSDAIDTSTRTLLTEVDVPNKDGKLLPGSFGQVHFSVNYDVRKVTIPVNAMLFRAEGPRVAVVGNDGKVRLRAITIGRDYGATLEVQGGLDLNEVIVINPADSLEDGQKVSIEGQPQGGNRS